MTILHSYIGWGYNARVIHFLPLRHCGTHLPSLEQYKRKWIFNHKDLPVSEADKALIKPLDQKSSMEVWNKWISNRSSRSEQFAKVTGLQKAMPE